MAAKRAEEDEEDEDQEDGEGDDGEPEDDFNAAWEVLDLARALYEKRQEESDDVKLKLAETFLLLGDVSLETGELSSLISVLQASEVRRKIRPGYHRLQCRTRPQD